MVTIYTDGSCRGNPGPGGFGVVAVDENNKVVAAYREDEAQTTNNRMEIKAIIYALEHFGAKKGEFFIPIVYSDSSYCVNTFTTWIHGWKAKGWVRAKGQPIENLDLVQKYDSITNSGCQIELKKIKGHSTNLWNNIADLLATGKTTPEEVLKQYG